MQIDEIVQLRESGDGYKKIAAKLMLNVSTVKMYCLRHNIIRGNQQLKTKNVCINCGATIIQTVGRKRKFCCDSCRYSWNNKLKDGVRI